MAGPPPIPQDRETSRETPEVLRSLVDNTQLLVKKEIELAKLEIKDIVTARVMAVAFLVIAAVAGLFFTGFLLVTAAKALELVVAEWLAWLIVTGVLLVVIIVLLLLAKHKLRVPPNKPERTMETIETTKQWAQKKVQS